ncbi:15-hydroxyprostaglandin dehydrogenase [NAD(+)]-like [Onthophagus taurus]|uniref:15-hydroxyprostaglandin dehydrogenase [NAD(+)]-like n=1 Tax=Onthophagus taurus TaxID=166361 RepID=UPI0039BE1EA8
MALPLSTLLLKQYSLLKPLIITTKRKNSQGCNRVMTPPDDTLADKVAHITGAASGIGLVIAREFLKHGIKGVAISDIDGAQGGATLLQLQKEFGANRVIFTQTDVSCMSEFDDALQVTVDKFEGFDILVNNAGMLDDKQWERTIQVNLVGVINGCILAMEKYIPKYKCGDEGIVMNIASIAGLQKIPTIPVYVSTKHALIGLGKCLSADFHYAETKSKIITICPGYYATPLTSDYFRGRTLYKRSEQVIYDTMSKPDFPMQKVDIFGKSIVTIIERSKNGSFWVIDKDNVSEVYLPVIKDLKKLQKIDVCEMN